MKDLKKYGVLLKKAIAVTIGITLTFSAFMLPARNARGSYTAAVADEYETDDCKYTYSIEKDSAGGAFATITDVEFSGDTVNVPSEIKTDAGTFPVRKIGNGFLNKNVAVKAVVFPDSVTYIGAEVLANSSVESIRMPNGLEHLGNQFALSCKDIKNFECESANIDLGEMGDYIFWDADVSRIVNDRGALCIGNWLVRYLPEDTIHVKFADLGDGGVKVEYVNKHIFRYLCRIKSVDLEGIKYIGSGTLRYCERLKTITNDEEVILDYDDYGIKETEWYDDNYEKGIVKLGKTLFYYKTDDNVLDLTNEEMGDIKTVLGRALVRCPNLDTIFCSSDCNFGSNCFYNANTIYSDGSYREDQFPEEPVYKIKNVYLDGKKLSLYTLVEDPAANAWLIKNISVFDNSEMTKELVEEKTKLIFEQMDIPYYGPGNDKIGTLSPTEEFYIRLKIFSYISMYDYDHEYKYRTVAGGLLLGGKFTCTEYALIAHYFLECAGVEAKTFFSDPTDPNVYGVHFWNATKLGDEWFLSDDGWSAQNNNHGYGWLLQSYSAFNTSEFHTMMTSYDSYHFYAESRDTEEITADRFFGDIDGDDDRDNDDSKLLWDYIKGNTSTIDKKRADINLDGDVNVTDAVLLDNMVHRKALDADNVPSDGFAPGFWIAFLNGEDYDDIKYIFTDREGYLTLPDDLFEAPKGKKISYDVGMAGQKVRITMPLTVVNVKWIDETEPDYSDPVSSVPDSSSSSSAPESSSRDDDSSKPDDIGMLGDVNNDRTIDIEDAVAIIQHINGMTPLKADEEKRADVSKDNYIDIDDAVMLISYINGNSTF